MLGAAAAAGVPAAVIGQAGGDQCIADGAFAVPLARSHPQPDGRHHGTAAIPSHQMAQTTGANHIGRLASGEVVGFEPGDDFGGGLGGGAAGGLDADLGVRAAARRGRTRR